MTTWKGLYRVLARAASCHFLSLSVLVTFGSRDRIPINQSINLWHMGFIVWRSATQWAMCGKHYCSLSSVFVCVTFMCRVEERNASTKNVTVNTVICDNTK